MYLLLFTMIFFNSHSPYLGCAYKVFASLWQDFGLPTTYQYYCPSIHTEIFPDFEIQHHSTHQLISTLLLVEMLRYLL